MSLKDKYFWAIGVEHEHNCSYLKVKQQMNKEKY